MEYKTRVFTYYKSHSETEFTVNFMALLTFYTLIGTAATIGHLIFACFTTFECQEHIPSVLYLGTFRGNDRIFIAICTYWAFAFILLACGSYISLNKPNQQLIKNVCTTSCVLSAFSIVTLSLFNEITSVHPVSFQVIISLFLCSLIVNVSVFLVICLLHSEPQAPKRNCFTLPFYILLFFTLILGILLLILNVFNLKYSKTGLLNQETAAILSWCFTISSMFLISLTPSNWPSAYFSLTFSLIKSI